MILQVRAATARGGEDLLPHRVVDHADLQFALMLDRDRYRKHRETVQEIGGAIQWIDDPDRLILTAAATLLGQNGMIGIELVDDLDDLAFGRTVDFADVVVTAFGADFQAVQPYQGANNDFAGATCGAHGNIEQWVHRKIRISGR